MGLGMDQQRPISLEDLPVEIIIQILSYVDPQTLRVVPLVCRTWHDILNDDAVWNAIFQLTFPPASSKPHSKGCFSSISRSKTYRTELLIRSHILHEYHKSRMTTQSFFISPSSHSVQLTTGAPVPVPLRTNTLPVRNLESLHVDWVKHKLTVLDVPQDTLISCHLRTGKNSSAIQDFVPEGVTCFDWNSKLVVFGRWNGSVAGGFVDHKGLLMSKVKIWGQMSNPLANYNNSRVSCVCVVDSTLAATSIIPNEARKVYQGKSKFINQAQPQVSVNNKSSPALKSSLVSHSTAPVLGKTGTIGAFSGDEGGRITGWDVKTGEIIWTGVIQEGVRIRKLCSDGKTVLIVVLNDGTIWSLKGVFDKKLRDNEEVLIEKIGILNMDNEAIVDRGRFHVDYGGKNIITWNERELLVFSYDEDNRLYSSGTNLSQSSFNDGGTHHRSEARRYLPPQGVMISRVALEDNGKLFTPRVADIVGGDPLLTAICLNNGTIHIINSRDDEWDMLPISIITPNFLNEKDSSQVEILDDRVSQVASIAINSLVVFVSNHLGKVEVFNAMTGDYLRTALNKLSMTRLNQLGHFIREQGGNVLKIDERGSRGILIIGSYVQYFCFGEDISFIEQQEKRFKKGKNKSKGSMNTIKNNLDDYEYQMEVEELNSRQRRENLEKFNGGLDLEDLEKDDELQMAMALSLSVSETNYTGNANEHSVNDRRRNANDEEEEEEEEMRQLREVMELSLRESNSINVADSRQQNQNQSQTHDYDYEDDEMDDDLRLAIELSKQENLRNWEAENEDQWQQLR